MPSLKTIATIPLCFLQPSLARLNTPLDIQSLGVPLDPTHKPAISGTISSYGQQKSTAGYVMYMLYNAIDVLWQMPEDRPFVNIETITPPLGQGQGNKITLVPSIPTGELKVSTSTWAFIFIATILGGNSESRSDIKTLPLPEFNIRLGPRLAGRVIGKIQLHVSSAASGAETVQTLQPLPIATDTASVSGTEVSGPEVVLPVPANTLVFNATSLNNQVPINFRAVFAILIKTLSVLVIREPSQPLSDPAGGRSFAPGSHYVSTFEGTHYLTIDIATAQEVPPGSYFYRDLSYGLIRMIYEMDALYGVGQWYEYEGSVAKKTGDHPFAVFRFMSASGAAATQVGGQGNGGGQVQGITPAGDNGAETLAGGTS